MAEIVGIFAASHAPPIVRTWDAISDKSRGGLEFAFGELRRRLEALQLDAIVMIGADHWVNFFLDNMPSMCLGIGKEHGGPPEPWLAHYPHPTMRGHPELAKHLARECFTEGFEPSVSHQMRLDHAFCVPLLKMGLDPLPPIVPIVINALEPPLPTMARCLAFGEVLARVVKRLQAPTRVALFATGGLSHAVGEALMGDVDEAFDRTCLDLFKAGDSKALLGFLSDERIAMAGNGAAEMRFWMAAHGAAGERGFELIHYDPIPEVFTGCGFAEWRLEGSAV